MYGGPSRAFADEANAQWDETHEFVIVGAGNAIFAAMAAQKAGKDVVVLEKSGSVGGTMRFSEGCVWAPGNAHMTDEYKALDTVDNVVDFMMRCDVFGEHSRDEVQAWVEKCPAVYDYLENTVGVPFYEFGPMHDYYGYENASACRTMLFGDGSSMDWWGDSISPLIDAAGLDVRLNTCAEHLVCDEDGRVAGVVATDENGDELRIKADKGVLLATGSFDHNAQMVQTYLQPPLVGTRIPEQMTGDGIAMGLELGADIAHMDENYHIPLVVTGQDASEQVVTPMLWWAAVPGCIYVGPSGRRFVNEGSSYDEQGRALRNFDFQPTGAPKCLSGNAVAIMDSACVEGWGWPSGSDEQPDWLRAYDTLEDLAAGEGIDPEALAAEVEKYNGFCDAGVDEDFDRGGSGPYDGVETGCYDNVIRFVGKDGTRTDVVNWKLVSVSEPPFYAAKIGRGSIGTAGGLVTNGDAQVLRAGEVIEGLYAAGCTADAPIDGYPGGGFPNSVAIVGSLSAINHALDLGIF